MSESDIAAIGRWSYGFAAVAFGLFAARLAISWKPGARAALLLSAMAVSAVWAALCVLLLLQPSPLAVVGAMFADGLRYALLLLFLAALLERSGARGRLWWLPYALVLALLAGTVLFVDNQPFGRAVVPMARTIDYAAHLGLAITGLVLVEQLMRRTDPQARWAIRPLCIGLGGIFAFDLYHFADAMLFGRLDPDIWLVRGAANALVIPFIAVAAARNTGWAIDLHLSRGAVYHSSAILLSGTFLVLVAGAGYVVRFVGGEWGAAFQVLLLFAALLVGILVVSSGSFRSRLRVFVSKHFFSYRYDYREEWLRFTRTVSDETSLRGVQEQIIKALADLVESPGGALWLSREDGRQHIAARWNMPVPSGAETADAEVASFLERTGWIVDVTEYARTPDAYSGLQATPWLALLPSAWLVIPLQSGSGLVGFVVLTHSRAKFEMNWEVRDLLKTASRQAASYLGQILATDALLEARKFDAFNRMSAFVVHDLKNLVAQLSLMLRNAERHRDNVDFQRDMLATVQNVVERMNHLMLQLRSGATPPEKPRLTDLEAVIRRVCSLHERGAARIELDLATKLHALGHEERLSRVIGHIVQNALDATTGGGSVRVRLYREPGHVVVEVKDSGVGMTQEFVRERLKKPFETTKPSGMGIGVYESEQYIAGLSGRLDVESAPGVGTCVRVRLPASDSTLSSAQSEAAA